MKYEAKNMMSIIFLETLNIEWGQIFPKGNRRVKKQEATSVSESLWACAPSTSHTSLHPYLVCLEESPRRQTLSIKATGGSCKNLIQADKESRVGEKISAFILLRSPIPSPYTWLWLIFLKSAVTSSMPRRWTDPPLRRTHTHAIYRQAGGQQKSRTEQFSSGIMR